MNATLTAEVSTIVDFIDTDADVFFEAVRRRGWGEAIIELEMDLREEGISYDADDVEYACRIVWARHAEDLLPTDNGTNAE